ncbi:hypothetical protein [Streptomyces sp. NBC_01445]|uniref:hypothetical protein n=1 Tax=Streptomyces sp. NBC_01445 TaxID=2903869 RepID=UPI002DDBE99B|nr:hypothetical protein [Streptomyces sp. NBC_01445]WSE05885.1 hypothetical protein OG574_22500 [Streptomyces sp. NBC_01445]
MAAATAAIALTGVGLTSATARAADGPTPPTQSYAVVTAPAQIAVPASGTAIAPDAGYSFADDGVEGLPLPENAKFVIDASGLKGIATIKAKNDQCTAVGAVVTCLDNGNLHGPFEPFTLSAVAGTKPGDTGTLRYEVTADKATPDTETSKVVIGSPKIQVSALPARSGLTPGQSVGYPVVLRNTGDLPTEQITVRLTGSPGVTFAGKHSNCLYLPGDFGRDDADVTCVFKTAIAPGATVGFSNPLEGSLGKNAFHTWTDITAEAVPASSGTDTGGTPGKGAALTLSPATGTDFADSHRVTYDADNAADFLAVGAVLVPGKKGSTHPLAFGLRNAGPAVVAHPDSKPVAYAEVTLPKGVVAKSVRVDEEPDDQASGDCYTYTGGKTSPFEPGHRRYLCPDTVSEESGDGQMYRFQVSYEKDLAAGAARGTVTVRPGDGIVLNDPDQSNDEAAITVGEASSSPSPSPSASGGTATPSPSASATVSVTSGGSGTSGTSGSMAATGAGFLPWLAAAAAAALGVGAIVFAMSRRRAE